MTTLPKSVFMFVDKTPLMTLLFKSVPVFQDTPFTTKSVPNAQPITSFKTITVSPVPSTQFTTQTLKSVIAPRDSF